MKDLEALKNINYKDVVIRAVWTFLQAAVAVFLLEGGNIISLVFDAKWGDLAILLKATGAGAIAAGLSALKTSARDLVNELRSSTAEG